MPKETDAGQASQSYAPATKSANQDELLAQAICLLEQLNEKARSSPRTPPLEGKAKIASESYQETDRRLGVLTAE